MLILLTGFAPFAGSPTNPSWEAVESLEDPPGVETLRHRLPVSYDRATGELSRLLDRFRPDALVLTGLAAGSRALRVESTAHRRAPTSPDEDGALPASADGQDLTTTLDVAALVVAARGEGIDAHAGSDAGDFVCNWTYRAGLEWARRRSAEELWSPPTVFVHVPPVAVAPTGTVAAALSRLLAEVARQVRRVRSGPGVATSGACRALLLRPPGRPAGRALRIGVSGGIGSGKSTVTEVLRRRGAVVADADRIAREVVGPGTPGLREVLAEFGPGVAAPDGGLDRQRLARIVFEDPGARARLEAITLPRIADRSREVIGSVPPDGVAVYDMPLLVELGAREDFDAVVMVDAPARSRLERLTGRGVGAGDARARMAAQVGTARRREVATVWIDNEGTRGDLADVVDAVATRWLGVGRTP